MDNCLVEAVAFSDNSAEIAIFSKDGILSIQDLSGKEKNVFKINSVNVDYESDKLKGIRLYFHSPFVCVSQRFGLKAAVVNIATGAIMELSREDYCSNISSYSIGFLEYEGKTLLVHQTQWNRLDVTDLSTGKIITEREIYCKIIGKRYNDKYKAILTVYDNKNYLDFSHSLIHVAPDSSYFLSNGWQWHPIGNISAFNTAQFLQNYELCNRDIHYWNSYNWDRPCTFIDSKRFVIATDNREFYSDPDEDKTYRQLWFFNVEDFDGKYIEPYKKIRCYAFDLNYENEIAGELYYDKEIERLISISEKGAFLITLDGEITEKYQDIKHPASSTLGFVEDVADVWHYSTFSHVFYRYNYDKNAIQQIKTICK